MSRHRPVGRLKTGDLVILSSGCSGRVAGVVLARGRRIAVVFVCQPCGLRHVSNRGPFERLRVARSGLLAA